MSRNRRALRALARRAGQEARAPWPLLTSALGGGASWAIGIPVAGAVGVAAAMLGAAVATAVVRSPEPRPDTSGPRLRGGTPQARLVSALDGYLDDLRRLRSSALPDSVTSSAVEALVAAGGAREVSLRVAAALDGLDEAIDLGESAATSRSVAGSAAIQASLARMRQRRDVLLTKLDAAVGGVAEAYTKLLELSATAAIAGDEAAGATGLAEVATVNASLDALRGVFSELESDARAARALA